jgi:predicted RND superfamily exporter protein
MMGFLLFVALWFVVVPVLVVSVVVLIVMLALGLDQVMHGTKDYLREHDAMRDEMRAKVRDETEAL